MLDLSLHPQIAINFLLAKKSFFEYYPNVRNWNRIRAIFL